MCAAWALIALGGGCGPASCGAPPAAGPCSQRVEASAAAQVAQALAGAQGCQSAADCIALSTPCDVPETGAGCTFQFAAVALASEQAVQHAFSVTAAETCGDCTPNLSTGGFGGGGAASGATAGGLFSCSNAPATACAGGRCALVPGGGSSTGGSGGGQGAFEWSCDGGCGPDQYCEVGGVTVPCPGWTGFVAIGQGGACLPAAGEPFSCTQDSDCGLGRRCLTGNGSCTTGCTAQRPLPCAADAGPCQLAPDDHGCWLCFCPDGCPPPPDAG